MEYAPNPAQHTPTAQENCAAILEGETQSFPGNVTIIEYFQKALLSGQIDSNAPAIISEEKEWTFDDLETLSTLLAIVLKKVVGDNPVNNNPDGDFVFGVCVPPSDKLILLLFAIMKLDAAYVPIDITFPQDRVQRIVDVARPIMIIADTDATAKAKFEQFKDQAQVISLQNLWNKCELLKRSSTMAHQVETFPANTSKPQITAIVLFTSGSSGAPKGVRLSHRTIMNRLNWQWKQYPFVAGEMCCFKTALTFVDSVPEIFATLLRGVPLAIIPKSIVSQSHLFIQKIKAHKVTRLTVVPSFLESILTLMEISEDGGASERDALASLNLWVCSGEAMTHELLIKFFKHFPSGKTLCNFYGSTEIMGDVTFEDFRSVEDVNAKCIKLPDLESLQVPLGAARFNIILKGRNFKIAGRAICNNLVYILDPEQKLTPAGDMGEVCIAGYNLATGYVGIKDSDKFIPNPHVSKAEYNVLYRTGDYGQIQNTPAGYPVLIFNGRVDSQVKVRGHRVDLSEIEAAVKASPLIAHGVVLCYHPAQSDQAIVAFVVPQNGATLSKIAASVKQKLLAYQMPVLKLVPEIPRLVNGKTDRQLLLQQYHAEMQTRTLFEDWDSLDISQDNKEEFKILVRTISDVTGTPIRIIVDDLDASFFDIGGTSLNSLNVISILRNEKIIIPITAFVSAKSIRELGSYAKFSDLNGNDVGNISAEAKKRYGTELLSNDHMKEVVHLISSSFAKKGDLEPLVGAQYSDFIPLITSAWPYLVEANLSFVVRRLKDNQITAASLNFDAMDEPEDLTVTPGLVPILSFLEDIESKQRPKLPNGKGDLLHNFMMGTHEDLDNATNVFMIQFMEEENIRIAKSKNFKAALTTNTSPITQSLGKDVLGYETLSEVRVKDYVDEHGNRPFANAPDTQTAVVCWKDLRTHNA